MTTLKALALVAALALPGAAQAWEEPARGTELRGDSATSTVPSGSDKSILKQALG